METWSHALTNLGVRSKITTWNCGLLTQDLAFSTKIMDFLLQYILLLNHAGKCLSWLIWVNPSQTLNIDIWCSIYSQNQPRFWAPLTITYHQWMKTELQVPCIEEIRRSYQTSRHAGTCWSWWSASAMENQQFSISKKTSENTKVGSKLLLLVCV
jgi:hypothetical protein